MSDATTPNQDHQQSGLQVLFAALCFGPPLAFFVWVSVRYFDWTVLLIPGAAIIAAAAVHNLAKEHPRTEYVSRTRPPEVAAPEPTLPPAAKPTSRSLVIDSVISVSTLLVVAVLFLSHIGPHDPEEHGNLPIEVQAVLAVAVVTALGWLAFRRLAAWVRFRHDRLK